MENIINYLENVVKKTNRNLLENNVRQKNGLLTLWVEVPRSIFGIKIKIIINLIRLKHVILINSQIYYKIVTKKCPIKVIQDPRTDTREIHGPGQGGPSIRTVQTVNSDQEVRGRQMGPGDTGQVKFGSRNF